MSDDVKIGRPSLFTQALADEICERIATGSSLREICREESMPCMASIFNWLRKDKDFVDQYARAKEAQVEALGEELLDISDDGSNDWMIRKRGDEEIEVVNSEAIQRSKLRVDTRKWLMSKLAPKKYGDKLQQEISGANGAPIQAAITVEFVRPNGSGTSQS